MTADGAVAGPSPSGAGEGRPALRALALVAASGLVFAGAAAAQELPFREYLRIDPRKVMTAEACGECHLSEHAVWKKTPHATGFRTLHRKEQALAIAGKLGFRLIKRDSICFSCHYTPVVDDGEIRVDSGVSCESCHGAGRDWIKVHNDYGAVDDPRGESAAHRRERIEASRAAGMRRPSDLYPVVANCFSCHTVPNEQLVNVAGHTTGSSDFEFVEWSQGEIRHNFLASTLAGAGQSNAERPLSRKRVMYVVGRALDLEYSLRGVAEASGDGIYAKAMTRRVRGAVAEMRAIDRAAGGVPEIAEMLDVVRGVSVVPDNRAALIAAAERVGSATRRFLDGAEPDRLAGLDDLVLGREPEPPPEVPAAVVAAADVEPGEAGGPAADAAPSATAGGGSGGGSGGRTGGATTTAAGSPARTAAPAATAGPIRRRLRPVATHRTLGPAACGGCHTRQNEWWFQDAHYRSADPFFDGEVDNIRIATLYGLSPAQMTLGSNLCMDCHGTVISGKESREVLDGVSCESCHGAAGDWLEAHKDETDKHLGRSRPGHLAALERGKADLGQLPVRATTCVGCHYVTDPRLLSAGHPSGADKDWVEAMGKVRHWDSGPASAADLRAAYGAAVGARGAVPRVELAALAGGDAAVEAAVEAAAAESGRRRRTTSLAGARRDAESEVLTLRPPPPRPAGSVTAAAAAGELELPAFPDVDDSAPIDEVLTVLQQRLALLYRLAGQGGGGG